MSVALYKTSLLTHFFLLGTCFFFTRYCYSKIQQFYMVAQARFRIERHRSLVDRLIPLIHKGHNLINTIKSFSSPV